MLITGNVESVKMYQEGGKKKNLIIKSPRGNHYYKLRCYFQSLLLCIFNI